MNNIYVNSLIRSVGGGFDGIPISDEDKENIIRFFDFLEANGVDTSEDSPNDSAIWMKANRCSLQEFIDAYYEDDDVPDDIEERYNWNFPTDEWYKFRAIHNRYCRAIFLNGRCLCVAYTDDTSWNQTTFTQLKDDFFEWLTEQAKAYIEICKTGSYNDYIKNNLPIEYWVGEINRKTLWDILPSEKELYRKDITEDELSEFMHIIEKKEELPLIKEMTPRKFYEACALCYPERKDRTCFYKDTEQEHARYGDVTPKELYFYFADGRDDGLKNVPMDDPEAFKEWFEEKGPYFESNGRHPWEIIGSGSIAWSVHLYPRFVKREDGSSGWHFALSGSSKFRTDTVVHSIINLNHTGIPVVLYDAEKICARLNGEDTVMVVPEYMDNFDGTCYDSEHGTKDCITLMSIEDDEAKRKVVGNTTWRIQSLC